MGKPPVTVPVSRATTGASSKKQVFNVILVSGVVWMCASINLSQLRLSLRRLEQEIAEPCCREERMAGGATVNTPNTCRRKQWRELFPSSRPDDADWLFPAPPDTLTVYRSEAEQRSAANWVIHKQLLSFPTVRCGAACLSLQATQRSRRRWRAARKALQAHHCRRHRNGAAPLLG
ncbi:uncharacterized protein LOC135115155 [Scylla paramamosain]|uniref:uncharacterized protein LOC135115155 n=1 Tax=Scylla paramamosain TaxID=85552 RepID=UPI003083301F